MKFDKEMRNISPKTTDQVLLVGLAHERFRTILQDIQHYVLFYFNTLGKRKK